MIAVTIISPSFQEVGMEAVKRFRAKTGMDVQVLFCEDKDAYWTKLNIPNIVKTEQVVFFDADYWLIKAVDLKQAFCKKVFYAVHDHGVVDPLAFPGPDSDFLGIDRELYFNSGFWVADFNDKRQIKAFATARQLLEDNRNRIFDDENGKSNIKDFGEQSVLNTGIQRHKCKLHLMPLKWNYFHLLYRHGAISEIPWGIIGLHAAAVPVADKLAHLINLESMLTTWRDEKF